MGKRQGISSQPSDGLSHLGGSINQPVHLIYCNPDFARAHPEANVLGQDISLIQPTKSMPPNCSFVREDTEEPWVFEHKFDYIHWRLMLTCCE